MWGGCVLVHNPLPHLSNPKCPTGSVVPFTCAIMRWVTSSSLLSVLHPFCTWPGLTLRHLSSLHAAEGPLALIKIQFPVKRSIKKLKNTGTAVCYIKERALIYAAFHQVFLVAPIFDNKIIFIIHIQPNKGHWWGCWGCLRPLKAWTAISSRAAAITASDRRCWLNNTFGEIPDFCPSRTKVGDGLDLFVPSRDACRTRGTIRSAQWRRREAGTLKTN